MTFTKTFSAFSRTFGGSVILAAAILAAVLAGPAKANGPDVVLGNLGSSGAGGLGGSGVAIAGQQSILINFTTPAAGPGSLLELNDVVLGLQSSGATKSFTASVSTGGDPAVWTATSDVTTTAGKVTFADTGPAVLSPSTTYTLTLTPPDAATYSWFFSDPFAAPSEQNLSGWNFLSSSLSTDGPTATGAVSISAVPEPATIMLLATAAAAVGGGVLRRRMKAEARN